MMKIFIVFAMAFAIFAAVFPVQAQQAAKDMALVGFLMKRSGGGMGQRQGAFLQGLRDLGYVEGKNIEIVYRSADGRPERLPEMVAEMIDRKVDVIVTLGGGPVEEAMKATSTIPIVVAVAGDFIATGLAKSLRRPGGNVTGQSTMAHNLMGKQLQLLKEVVPTLSRVAIIRFKGSGSHSAFVRQAKAAAPILNLEIIAIDVGASTDLPGAFRQMKTEGVDGVLVLRSGFLIRMKAPLNALAQKAGLPTMFGHRQEVESGGLMAYGADTVALFYGAAAYVDQILRGANPAEMPVAQATRLLFYVNLKTAKALGITVPPSILLRADKVFE